MIHQTNQKPNTYCQTTLQKCLFQYNALLCRTTRQWSTSNSYVRMMEYTDSQKLLPDIFYDFQNDNNVRISYYKKHHLFKWSFYCGLNFTEDESVKFASTLNKEYIKRSRFLWFLRKNST